MEKKNLSEWTVADLDGMPRAEARTLLQAIDAQVRARVAPPSP